MIGFDLGDNAHTSGVLVEVQAEESQAAGACQPTDVDAASAPGEHNSRLTIGVGQSIPLGLSVDRNLVGEVRYTVDVLGGDSEIHPQQPHWRRGNNLPDLDGVSQGRAGPARPH